MWGKIIAGLVISVIFIGSETPAFGREGILRGPTPPLAINPEVSPPKPPSPPAVPLPAPVKPPQGAVPEKGVLNPRTGEFYPGTTGGVINPRTGEVLPKVGGGYISPKTGEFIPSGQ